MFRPHIFRWALERTASAPQSAVDTASGSELTVATLESELAPVAAKWETLGRKLGLEEWRLKNIAADIPPGRGASMRRLSTVLDEWCTNATERSWNNIVCALKDMQESALAREIEKKYCSTVQGFSQSVSCETQQEQSDSKAVALVHRSRHELMMNNRFTQLQTVVYQKIQARLDAKEINIRDFRVYMTNLFPPKECIPETTDVSEVFQSITNNHLWDYINYQPLERVANMYGGNNPDLKAKLEAYIEELNGYKAVTKMKDYLSTVTVTSDKSSPPLARYDEHYRIELTVKLRIPVSALTSSYIENIWKLLAKRFLLPPSSAILDKIIEGSLSVTWLIPALFVPQMMELSKQPKIVDFFREIKADIMTVDGAYLYDRQDEQEDSSDVAFDEDQEPPPKAEGLATAVNSFQEESVEPMADQHHDTQAQSSSVCGVEENQFDGEKLSSKQDKLATATASFQEERVVMATDKELHETIPEVSSLGVAEATSVKPVTDKPSLHLHSHPEGLKLPSGVEGQELPRSSGAEDWVLLQSNEAKGHIQLQSSEAKGQELPQFSILVCGKTGIGKSTLINFLLGKDVCEIGDPGAIGGSLKAQTMYVTDYSIKMNGVLVIIFDSPGLQDGTGNDEKYLADMYAKCRNVNLVFYCHDMSSARWTDHEVNAMRLLTRKFGPTFWDKVVFVLTKANMVQPAKPMTKTETKDHFKNWADNSEKCFRDELKKQLQAIPAGEHASSDCQRTTESDTIQKRVKEIPAVPTGSEAVQILPNGKHFIGNLWVSCIERITDPYLTEVFMQATSFKERLVTREEVERKGHLFGITLEGLVHAGSAMKRLTKEILYADRSTKESSEEPPQST